MARYRGPKSRLSRREGVELFSRWKNSVEKRKTVPGQHGARRTKLSNYGIQLREKQKVKRIYGVLERQFRKYYLQAATAKGVTGDTLLQFLERRLDNVLFQMGFAVTRPQARQIVGHGLVLVNDKKVDIPSYLVKEGDEVAIKPNDKIKKFIRSNVELIENRAGTKIPSWLNVDAEHFKGKVLRLPQRDDITFPINEQLIVELYSK
ncbi:MAG: 30S ribosomal protein S4 [Candidatus Omnitrophica bacterium]|nr:30S ribosomal protein S4 [Candidatus Omnitrophota bacterium]